MSEDNNNKQLEQIAFENLEDNLKHNSRPGCFNHLLQKNSNLSKQLP